MIISRTVRRRLTIIVIVVVYYRERLVAYAGFSEGFARALAQRAPNIGYPSYGPKQRCVCARYTPQKNGRRTTYVDGARARVRFA